MSFTDAFKSGNFHHGNGMKYVFGWMREESDAMPEKYIWNYTKEMSDDYIGSNLDQFHLGLGNEVLEAYPFEAMETPQQGYDQILTDTRVSCGNLELTRLASKWAPNDVYAYMSTQGPATPICSTPYVPQGYCCRYSFHMYAALSADSNSDFWGQWLGEKDWGFGTIVREKFMDLGNHFRKME